MFLLRQYFMSIPRELDEAAMIDGAGPFRILRSIIVPQSVAAIIAVSLFHFFFAWNDFFVPLLVPRRASPSSSRCRSRSSSTTRCTRRQPTLIQASALMTMAVPIVVFLLRSAGVHARRGRHRASTSERARGRRARAVDWPVDPAVAWRRGIGVPCDDVGHAASTCR